MQRIDENTYIDDTLVTCAEYQLFIDEMREQGKYYQPDHWTSCQFPAGHAQEYILGVRLGDAEAFCEWLTQREASEWYYRLPSTTEANEYPLRFDQDHSPLGYWIVDREMLFRFQWIHGNPLGPRGIAIDIDISQDPDIYRALRRARSYPLDIDRSHNLDIDIDPARDYARKLSNDRNLTFNHDVSISRTRNLALDLAREPAREHNLNLAYLTDLALDLYADIFTLQERIAGRSPAFEGIRLVKERIN